jgi:hypothetical protein
MKTNQTLEQLFGKEIFTTETALTVEAIAATRTESIQPQVFGVADLWKLERSRRARTTRKHFAF